MKHTLDLGNGRTAQISYIRVRKMWEVIITTKYTTSRHRGDRHSIVQCFVRPFWCTITN